MTCPSIILAAWALLPTWYGDRHESAETRDAHRLPVAEAICRATTDAKERRFLAAQAYAETTLAKYVIEDRCSDGPVGARCDQGRATGLWQIHPNQNECSRRAWDRSLPASERHLAGAQCALANWRYGVARCKTDAGGFASQAGGIPMCNAAWARRRVALMRKIGGQL